ncbi:MAG: helix-turn-helix domain-containing protein [Fibromonadaceae bacterium]|jgi:transcriptional regulator with XRE-family HTH domain|nr:helix-turn-helix domain-containing protein [Fibromonadaceae bacterium]
MKNVKFPSLFYENTYILDMETGEGIKSFRDRKRWKQADLAKELGIIQQNISIWEAGKGTPSFAMTKKLLELGITVEELFGVEYTEKHGLIMDKTAVSIADTKLEQMQKKIEIVEEELKRLKLVEKVEERKIPKIRKANRYFDIAKECLEKKNIEEKDIKRYFEMLRLHYNILVEIEKELDYTDIKHLNELNYSVENACEIIKELTKVTYPIEVMFFFNAFRKFVIYCYNSYYHYVEEDSEKKYFDKAIEVLKNLHNKINRENKSLNEYTNEFLKKFKVMDEKDVLMEMVELDKEIEYSDDKMAADRMAATMRLYDLEKLFRNGTYENILGRDKIEIAKFTKMVINNEIDYVSNNEMKEGGNLEKFKRSYEADIKIGGYNESEKEAIRLRIQELQEQGEGEI